MLRNDMTKIAQLSLSKHTFAKLNLLLIVCEQLQHNLHMSNMLLKTMTVYENIVKEY
jgi:hypothetical protein